MAFLIEKKALHVFACDLKGGFTISNSFIEQKLFSFWNKINVWMLISIFEYFDFE